MDIRDCRTLKGTAVQCLEAAVYDPKKLIFLHTSATLALTLLMTLADFFLSRAISGTGGLGGFGTRSVLSTLQSCLLIAQLIVLPFWMAGYQWISLQFARQREALPRDLLAGFRLFWPLLRLLAVQCLLYFVIAMAASYFGSFLFLLTPYAKPLWETMLPIMQGSGDAQAIYASLEPVLQQAQLPMTLCGLALFFPLAAPFFYRFRLAQFLLLEQPKTGALRSILESWKKMQGRSLALLKLDLSFWWFYLLDALITVFCYGDQLLPLAGISLPIGKTAAFFLFFGLSLVLQLGLYVWRQNQVSTTYALFYTMLDTSREAEKLPAKAQPWDYG